MILRLSFIIITFDTVKTISLQHECEHPRPSRIRTHGNKIERLTRPSQSFYYLRFERMGVPDIEIEGVAIFRKIENKPRYQSSRRSYSGRLEPWNEQGWQSFHRRLLHKQEVPAYVELPFSKGLRYCICSSTWIKQLLISFSNPKSIVSEFGMLPSMVVRAGRLSKKMYSTLR